MINKLLTPWRKLAVRTQLLLLLLFATVLAQVINIAIQMEVRHRLLTQEQLNSSFDRIRAVADFISHLPEEQRQIYLSSLNLGPERYVLQESALINVELSQPSVAKKLAAYLENLPITADAIQIRTGDVGRYLNCKKYETLPDLLTPPIGQYSTWSHPCFSELVASVHIPTIGWLNLSHNLILPSPFMSWHYWLTNLITLVVTVVVIVFALHFLLKPIQKLQQAVQRSGHNLAPTLVDEQGAADIRSLIQEYNQMQQRIGRFVENRTQLLAAISHDLRTPITSMRLRLDFLPDSEDKAKLLETLEQLKATADASLNFVRETKSDEPFIPLDLQALVEACCEDLQDTGLAIDYLINESTPHRAICTGQPNALRRAIQNLLQNAVKYGEQAKAWLTEDEQSYRIEILDQGPGIPESEQERVFEPFVRLEGSRNKETGGAGLGLAITRSIADDHGGQIEFYHSEQGFKVSLVIPKA